MSKLNIAKIDKNMGFTPETKTEERRINNYEECSREELYDMIEAKDREYNKMLDKIYEDNDSDEYFRKLTSLQQELVNMNRVFINKYYVKK